MSPDTIVTMSPGRHYENIGEPDLRIDVVELGGADEADMTAALWPPWSEP